jgi:hypothetical protein
LMRQESRGAHYRSNFSNTDYKKWKVNICCKRRRREMVLFKQPVSRVKEPIKNLVKVQGKVEHHLLE